MMKLNLGCGFDIKDGYINLDIINNPGVDIVHDLGSVPYPFDDNTFSEIYTSMVLEHVKSLTDVLDELVRIGRNGCELKIIVPYFSSPNLWGDPTHIRGFNTNTFSGFHSNSLRSFGKLELLQYKIHFLSNGHFMKSSYWNMVPDLLINLLPKIYERFFCYILPSSEIHYLLRIKK